MGHFRVALTLYPWGTGSPRRVEALVDSGAGYSVIPRPLLDPLGCRPQRLQRVVFADGRVEEWPVTQVEVECEARRGISTVLMGPPGAQTLLGATTLQELGLGIDPVNHRLVPVELYPV